MKRQHYTQMKKGEEAGIGDGFTVPSNVPGEANGSCNFVVRKGRELPDDQLMMAQLVGSYAFQAARSIVTHSRTKRRPAQTKLSPRQIDCISLIGRGKTDWEIGQILGISKETVKEYIDDARKRYHVTKRVQLVLRAVYDGHIPLLEFLK